MLERFQMPKTPYNESSNIPTAFTLFMIPK